MKATVELIREIIKKEGVVKNMDTLSNDESLASQGIDSLDLSNIYLVVEEEFGVTIPDADLDKVESINNLIAYINK